MRFTAIVAASVLALGILAGQLATSSDARTAAVVQQRTVADPSTGMIVMADNNGNG
jgi:hypothetical protein